ncbi:MAG: prephenate dehydratase [Ferrovibrio sp.]|uniref:prephenate dehydratase n=1 Tax=Ferrovibrio sp. TaxID=1917215 RepID=UPI00262D93F4|nr:prephenate dehydratase [Ferrovibrio sp.]MCW0236177.1 prephenate dehydratase [Ferrovibrio sp.]
MSPVASIATEATDPARIVAFQGAPGAYSHLACREALPDLVPLPCASFEDAFAAVREGRAACGLIPIENSTAGRVADIHQLLPEGGLFITAEHFLRVRHQLLAPRAAALKTVKRVYSHVQGLSQCRKVIKELGLDAIVASDTAGSAKDVSERNSPEEAAIASSIAGELYGLQVLRADIEDNPTNTTRFIKLERQRRDPDPKAANTLTAIMFRVRSVPAALYKALGGFATNGVNVVKLESYLSDGFQVAEFYAEIEGHPAHKSVDLALQELEYFSSSLKIIGVFGAHPFRAQS